MGIPYNNNGTIKDQLVVCNHINKYFLTQESTWDNINNLYGKEYKEEYLKHFCETFKREDYNDVKYISAKTPSYNGYLKENNCPYKFSKQPRTGYICIFKEILAGKSPVVFGFSITKETRKSYYVNDCRFVIEDAGNSCHSKEDEISILRWLHENKFVDATLCMLQDEDSPILNCTGLIPSEAMINLLKLIYKNLEIIK